MLLPDESVVPKMLPLEEGAVPKMLLLEAGGIVPKIEGCEPALHARVKSGGKKIRRHTRGTKITIPIGV